LRPIIRIESFIFCGSDIGVDLIYEVCFCHNKFTFCSLNMYVKAGISGHFKFSMVSQEFSIAAGVVKYLAYWLGLTIQIYTLFR
jgi:hypothetical protein